MHFIVSLLLLVQGVPALPGQSGTIAGTLRTSAGMPAAHVRVSAMSRPDNFQDVVSASAMVSLTETDDSGRYRLENIPPGHYFVVAGRVDLPTYYPGALEMSGGTDLLITPGVSIPGIDFTLKDNSAGRAMNSLGSFIVIQPTAWEVSVNVAVENEAKLPIFSPVGYPAIRLTRISDGVRVESPLDITSKLTVPDAAQADYRVTVENVPFGYVVKSIKSDSTDLLVNVFTLPPLKTAIPPGAQLTTGTVILGPQTTQTAAATLVQLVASSITIQSGAAPSSKSISIVLTKLSPSTPPTNGVAISGRTNAPRVRAVYLSGSPGTLYSDGTFEFRGVLPGRYTILNNPSVMFTVGASVVVGDMDLAGIRLEEIVERPLDMGVLSKTAAANRNTSSSGLRTIRGRVLDEISGEPVARGRTTTGTVTVNGNKVSYSIDDEGRFTIPRLLPGKYNLDIYVFGFGMQSKPVEVGDEDFDFTLTVHDPN